MAHDTDAELLRDIEEHMRKMWDARLLPAACWPTELAQRLTQAVRRAPAAPEPQEPTSKQVVLGAGALLGQPENTADNRHPDWHSAVAKARSVYLAMLAAAPQPPEAAPVRKPLKDDEIEAATGAKQGTPLFLAAKGFTIAIERAHGIKD